MKLSDATKKLTCMKSNVVRALAAATLAGAFLAASPAAQAQHFAVGVQVGGPRYVAGPPVYIGPDRYDRYRYDRIREREAFERHEAFVRHEEWERAHRYDRGYYGHYYGR
jgi:hypothetical protein